MQPLAKLRCLCKESWKLRHTLLRPTGCRLSSSKAAEPLRILFCGSDHFSVASLRAIHHEHIRDPELIASIDVACRPGKRTGRGLKTVREVPIKSIAQALAWPVHEIDTFTGWTPPSINLVIAVSFGLLVPPRILNGAKYGGLNLHPSLLPDLRGPAPLHHTLLQRRVHTGVSLQTLHPKYFDQGTILAQTPLPGLKVPDKCTPDALLEMLTPVGADMLVQALRGRLFVPPLAGVRTCRAVEADTKLKHAPKVTPKDRQIDWATWTADEILLRHHVLGNLWDDTSYRSPHNGSQGVKRTIYHGWEALSDSSGYVHTGSGHRNPFTIPAGSASPRVVFDTCGRVLLSPTELTIEGMSRSSSMKAFVESCRER
ncbi:formyl transferase [Cryomyces antarcticus]